VKLTPDQFEVNEAWIVARMHTVMFVKNEPADIYVLVDAASSYVLGHLVYLAEAPSRQEFTDLFKQARKQSNGWPKRLLITSEDPGEDVLKAIAADLGIVPEVIPLPYLDPILGPLNESFARFRSGKKPRVAASGEPGAHPSALALIPDSYDLCPCASGKKYKFCCKIILHEVTEAMCAFEDGNFEAAVKWLDQAKEKVGETAEVLARYGIAYSLKSETCYLEYLHRALKENPNHPRTHYLFGLHHRQNGRLKDAAAAYEKAIKNYPATDKFHLNETWNNLGGVYFDLGELGKSKGAWEKALMYMPSDTMTKKNLREFIYDNPEVPEDLRRPSPFVARYL
jgi:hypothetical protein